MNKVLKYLILFLLVGTLLYINPKEIYHHYKSEKRLSILLSDPSVLKSIEESPVTDINSVGNGVYFVTTENNKLMVKVTHQPTKTIYTIFQHKTSITHFSQ